MLSIDVDQSGVAKALRLIETCGETGLYAALSHCWGPEPDFLVTNSDNLQDHMKSISLDDLPQNFKDAVEVATRLGLQYLWIDSLCIVQDDDNDWRKQSAKMKDVFENAFLTIAATAASCSREGFLTTKLTTKHATGHLLAAGEIDYHARLNSMDLRSLYESPLYKRAWVLQEMVLSRRTVHFAKDQLYWSCRSFTKSEDGIVDDSSVSNMNLQYAGLDRKRWWTWATDYSRRKLTKPNDKYAALAGLTKFFAEISGMKPRAGLWYDDIHFGLLWYMERGDSHGRLLGPSWSWMSFGVPIHHIVKPESTRWKDHDEYTDKVAEITEISVEGSNLELISPVSSGRIRMRARLKPVSTCPLIQVEEKLKSSPNVRHFNDLLPCNHYGSTDTFLLYWQQSGNIKRPPEVPCIGTCTLDSGSQFPGNQIFGLELSIYCRCRGATSNPANTYLSGYQSCEGRGCSRDILIVRLVSGETNEYERIGAGHIIPNLGNNRNIHPHHDYFCDAPLKDIVLV